MGTQRDWIEWIVDIGGVLGGVASLIAVIVGLVALRPALGWRPAAP